ncbi:MAG: ABC transporter permease [Chloroflexota bacterium]
MPLYLALKEIRHNKGRFILISLIVTLITTLVLFIAALAQGLADSNKEYIESLTGELIVYQSNVELSIPSSRLGRSKTNQIRRVEGVADAGQIGFASATIVFDRQVDGAAAQDGSSIQEPLDVSLIGVESGHPGEPIVISGSPLGRNRSNGVIIDENAFMRRDIQLGDTITIKSTQGTQEEFYDLTVVGIAGRQLYQFNPSLVLPYLTWEKVRPQANVSEQSEELVSNVVAVRTTQDATPSDVAQRLVNEVEDIEVVDRVTAYESLPGYAAQQSTLNTQRFFTLFIGILVIGGFFQIQTLQKVALIGMLKAIGASNVTVAVATVAQILIVNVIGVLIGGAICYALALSFPVEIPVRFSGNSVASALILLLIIGPVGGLVSVWSLLKVEPLTALGLAQ